MSIRARKLIGTIVLMAFLTLYALAAMMVAAVMQVNASKLGEALYYLTAGLGWVVPAGLVIRWMHRPGARRDRL